MKGWRGVAFEQVCWQHIQQIKRGLGIEGVKSSISAWNVKGDDQKAGAQVDLLIMRDDNIVNLCEMKFSGSPYAIDIEEEAKMLHRVDMLKETLSAKQRVHLTLITTFGLLHGKHRRVQAGPHLRGDEHDDAGAQRELAGLHADNIRRGADRLVHDACLLYQLHADDEADGL